MKPPRKSLLPAILVAVLCSAPLLAKDALDAGDKNVQKIEVTDSMMGYRDTLRFYVFEKDRAVLCVRIDNKDTKFPVSAKLYTFAEGVNAEGIQKWINNQHSDGIFADAPKPMATHELPATSCKMVSHELGKRSEAPNGEFDNYSVTFEIKDVPALGDLMLKNFTDKATVRIKTK